MESGDIEYACAKDVESTLRAGVTILNKVNPVLDENVLAYLPGGEIKKKTTNINC